MAAPTAVPVTSATTSLAVLMASMPFGVSFPTLMLGGAAFFGGCGARTGLKLYRKLDGDESVTVQALSRSVAALLCCIPLAAAASCIVFLAAHVLKIEADAALGGLLLIMGLRGPEGFQWLMDTFANSFTKIVPGQKPRDGGGG